MRLSWMLIHGGAMRSGVTKLPAMGLAAGDDGGKYSLRPHTSQRRSWEIFPIRQGNFPDLIRFPDPGHPPATPVRIPKGAPHVEKMHC